MDTARWLGSSTLDALIETADQGIAVVDEEGRYAYVNPAGCQMLGASLEDLVGRPARVIAGAQRSTPHLIVLDHDHRLTADAHPASAPTSSTATYAASLAAAFDAVADAVCRVTGISACTVVLWDEETGGFRGVGTAGGYPDDYAERLEQLAAQGAPLPSLRAFKTRKPVVMLDWRHRVMADPRYAPVHDLLVDRDWGSMAAVPLKTHGEVIGGLTAFYPEGHDPTDSDIAFVSAIADLSALALENHFLVGELERKAALEERHRLARDLHDSVSQALFSLTLQTRAVELANEIPGNREVVSSGLAELRRLTQGIVAEMRALIYQLRPAALHEEGLAGAVRHHAMAVAARHGIRVTVEAPDDRLPLDPDVEGELFRVGQEALNNVVKHSQATEVTIRYERSAADGLIFAIADDGVGFDPDAPHPGHFGLKTMHERTEALGGTMTVASRVGGPTSITVHVPGVVNRVCDGTEKAEPGHPQSATK